MKMDLETYHYKDNASQVTIEYYGYGISWNDDIDLGCNKLWENGVVES